MATSVSWGHTDTIATPKNIACPDLDFAVDYTVKSDSANLVRIANLTSPLDQVETIQFQYRDIPDIYKGTDINPSVYASSRAGIACNTSLRDIVRVTDDSDTTYQIDMPATCSVSLTVPLSSFLTTADLLALVARTVSALFNTGEITGARIASLVRGAMKPTGM